MSKKTKNESSSSDGKTKKGFESTYQAEKLRSCIVQGLSARSIMESLGIKSKQVLKQHVLKLIQEDKEFYEIPGLYEKGSRTIRATPKGELKIGPSVLRAQGITVAAGDEFHLSVDGDNIILSKVKKNTLPTDMLPEPPLMDGQPDDIGEAGILPDEIQE